MGKVLLLHIVCDLMWTTVGWFGSCVLDKDSDSCNPWIIISSDCMFFCVIWVSWVVPIRWTVMHVVTLYIHINPLHSSQSYSYLPIWSSGNKVSYNSHWRWFSTSSQGRRYPKTVIGHWVYAEATRTHHCSTGSGRRIQLGHFLVRPVDIIGRQ